MWSPTAIVPTLALLLCAGCGFGDATLEDIDPEAAPARPTWSEHIEPLMQIYCTACHAPDAQTGEAEGYGFETCEKTRRNWRGLYQTTFESETMPPGGGPRPLPWELLTLQRWYDQGATCE